MQNFNETINSETPVLIDFYANWCGPCKALSPILEQLQTEFEGKVNIVKVDVDENPELATEHNIKSIPTLMLFKQGKLIQTMKGFLGKDKVKQLISESL